MYLHFSCFVGQDHSAPLCRKTSRYCLLIHHSCPIFIAGISCCSIIFLICCLVVFSSTAVSATVNSSVTPTGHRPFSRPGSSHLCISSTLWGSTSPQYSSRCSPSFPSLTCTLGSSAWAPSAKSSRSCDRRSRWTSTAGGWRAASWSGTTPSWTQRDSRWPRCPKSCSTGRIPTSSTWQTRKTPCTR